MQGLSGLPGRSRIDLMADIIVPQGGTKMGPNIRFFLSHAFRSFGLKSDYLSLHFGLIRESAGIQAEMSKWFASLLLLSSGVKSPLYWPRLPKISSAEILCGAFHAIANNQDCTMVSTRYDPAIFVEIIDVLQDTRFVKRYVI